MAAADDINDIIERALNVAQQKADDAGGYSADAVAATNGLTIREDVLGDVPAFSPPAITPIPTFTAPTFSSPLSTYGEVQGSLEGLASGVFASLFPGIQDATANAIANLELLASRANDALNGLFVRTNRDTAAVTYINGAFSRANFAIDYVTNRYDAGRTATTFMQGKYDGGTQSTAFLLRRFAAGDASVTSLVNMITSGGTSIPAPIEDQTWERDRARVLKDNMATRATTIDTFAARGYPQPPGVLSMQLQMLGADAQDKIAESSRDTAIKQVDILIENIRTATKTAFDGAGDAGTALVSDSSAASRALLEDASAAARIQIEDAREAANILIADAGRAAEAMVSATKDAAAQMINLRSQAVAATADYLRALFTPGQIGAQVASAVASAEASAAEAMARYYSAEIEGINSINSTQARLAEITLQPALASARNRTDLHVAYNTGLIGIANAKVTAALGACQAAGNQGAAALSVLNAVASLTSSS